MAKTVKVLGAGNFAGMTFYGEVIGYNADVGTARVELDEHVRGIAPKRDSSGNLFIRKVFHFDIASGAVVLPGSPGLASGDIYASDALFVDPVDLPRLHEACGSLG